MGQNSFHHLVRLLADLIPASCGLGPGGGGMITSGSAIETLLDKVILVVCFSGTEKRNTVLEKYPAQPKRANHGKDRATCCCPASVRAPSMVSLKPHLCKVMEEALANMKWPCDQRDCRLQMVVWCRNLAAAYPALGFLAAERRSPDVCLRYGRR